MAIGTLYQINCRQHEGLNEITLMDVLGTDQELLLLIVENSYKRKRLVEKIRKLNHREKHVLELRYGLFSGFRKTQREIARKMGIFRSYVSRIKKKAIQRLIKELSLEK